MRLSMQTKTQIHFLLSTTMLKYGTQSVYSVDVQPGNFQKTDISTAIAG